MIKKIKARLLLFILVTIIYPTVCQAQINSDSLFSIWKDTNITDSLRFKAVNEYYKLKTLESPDSVLTVSKNHAAYAENKNNKIEISSALNVQSHAYYLKGENDKSMSSLKESIAILETVNVPISLANVYSNLGNIYATEHKYQEALQYFYKTLKIFKDEQELSSEARILNNIGIVFSQIGSSDLALRYFSESLEIYQQLGSDNKIARLNAAIGDAYYNQGKYAEAIKMGEAALGKLLETNNNVGSSDCYFLLSRAFQKMEDTVKSRYYLNKSLNIETKINNSSKLIARLIFDAELTYRTDLKKATKKAEDILNMLDSNTKNDVKVDIYNLLYRCYKDQEEYDLSLAMYENHVKYSDSLYIQKSKTEIVRSAIQKAYEDELLQTQIDNDHTQKKLKVNHRIIIGIIAAGFSLLILFLGLYFRSRLKSNRKEKNDLLEELESLKVIDPSLVSQSYKFELNKPKIEAYIERKINETDWKVLNILLDDPVIPNKEIAEKAYMSIDGIGSSLRRMYSYFEIKQSKYKKISLLMLAIKISNSQN